MKEGSIDEQPSTENFLSLKKLNTFEQLAKKISASGSALDQLEEEDKEEDEEEDESKHTHNISIN